MDSSVLSQEQTVLNAPVVCQIDQESHEMPPKKDPYATPGQKVIGLYSMLLFTGRSYSLAQLAEIFHCSKQTILRMIEQIEKTHQIEIESWMEEGQKWYRAVCPAKKPNVSLTVEEIQQLLLCRDIVWNWLPEGLRRDIEQTIAKATVLLPEYSSRSDAMSPLALARSKGVVDYSKSQEQLNTILKGLRERHICEVAYQSIDLKSPKVLVVAPYHLLAYREGLYVRCRLEKALDKPKDFYDAILAVHRMKSVTLTQRKFKKIETTENDGKNSFGLSFGKPFRAVVDIAPKAALYVRERIWSGDQKITEKKDGSLRLEFTANNKPELIAWVLSFGEEAVLREPEEVVKDLGKIIGKIHKNYG